MEDLGGEGLSVGQFTTGDRATLGLPSYSTGSGAGEDTLVLVQYIWLLCAMLLLEPNISGLIMLCEYFLQNILNLSSYIKT
jgi:hypothetical protein